MRRVYKPCRYPQGPLLRAPADLDIEDLASEEVLHVAGARVVLADYDVLQHDFPELGTDNLVALNPQIQALTGARQADVIRLIIDKWLIANAAYISTAQVAQQEVNSLIKTDGNRAIAYRPPKYGRALVIPTQSTGASNIRSRWRWPDSRGLLDIKGAGVAPDREPVNGGERTGLEYLGLAISDFFLKKAIDAIFARALPTVWTVPVYAVLDLGFDVVNGFHGTGPAGMHVRRAHRRRIVPDVPLLEQMVTLEIESVLRRYGITAATRGLQLHIANRSGQITWQKGSHPPLLVTNPDRVGVSLALLRNTDRLTLDRRDVQLARDVAWPPAKAQMVDFGALRVEERFECPMIRCFEKPTVNEVIWPGAPDFLQPDPGLQLPLGTWQRHKLAASCFQMAETFRRRATSPQRVRGILDDHIAVLTDKWLVHCGGGT